MKSDTLTTITEEDVRRLLIQRGFTGDEIDGNFGEYVSGQKDWGLSDISAREVAGVDGIEKVRILFRKDSVKLGLNADHEGHEDFDRYRLQYPSNDGRCLNASMLEPFIARFVIAINNCGIFTVKSCDGWHDRINSPMEKRMSIYFEDKYSALWFRLIMERLLGQSRYWYGADIFCAKGEALPDEYKRINRLACFFEQYGKELVTARDKWIRLSGEDMDGLEMRKFLRSGQLENIISGYVGSDLIPLREKWRELKERNLPGIQCWDLCELL